MLHDGTVFQGYMLDDSILNRDQHDSTHHIQKANQSTNSIWVAKIWTALVRTIKDCRGNVCLPDSIIKEIARCLLPDIIAYCESEEGKAAFAKWNKEQEKRKEAEDTEKSKVY